MTTYLGDYAAGATIYIPFHSFDSNGSSITLTGLDVTDIQIYKDGSVTQRSSTAGYTLLDTDGIDFDGATGCHGISVDLSDNSDAGFYATGSDYWVMINAVTIDTQTVRFWVAIFSIANRNNNVNIASTDDIDLSATQKASVNTEVDTALATTTYAEPGQGVPAATASLKDKIGYLYKFMRNKITSTNTEINVRDDGDTQNDQKSTISSDGTTFTRGEFGTGA